MAVLVRNTGCSVETKARLASYSVEPPHKLKYLILYGDEGLLPEEVYKFHHYQRPRFGYYSRNPSYIGDDQEMVRDINMMIIY